MRKLSPDAPLSEREKVEEITYLHIIQSSTARAQIADNEDIKEKTWLSNDVPITREEDNVKEKVLPASWKPIIRLFKEMMEKYPDKINVYGHSLGSIWMLNMPQRM